MAAVPDIPYDVDIQIQRQEFLVRKVIMKIPDDSLGDSNDEEDVRSGRSDKDCPIHSYSLQAGFSS